MLVDTHTHLHFPDFDPDRDAVIDRALAAGVGRMVLVGTDLPGSRRAVELAEQRPDVLAATVGIHPHEAATVTDPSLAELRALAARSVVVAIGEIGLDYFRDRCPRDVQRAGFLAQQALARELGLPLVVHCREAHADVLAALRAGGGLAGRVVVHCFTTCPSEVQPFLDAGCWIGTDGPVTYPRAADAREIVRAVPPDRLVLETDCPYLAPQGRRGQRCEPADLVAVAAGVAAARGEPVAAVIAATSQAAAVLYGWEA